MTTARILKLADRIKHYAEKANDYHNAHIEAMDTIKRTDVDAYREITAIQAVKDEQMHQNCIEAIKWHSKALEMELYDNTNTTKP